jgi:peroxiredoxin
MTVTVPVAVLVAQWVLLVSLGVFLILVYRQLAFLLEIGRGGKTQQGLPAGTAAPIFDYVPLNGTSKASKDVFETKGKWTILMFADPMCASCERAVASLTRVVRKHRSDGLSVLVATTSELEIMESVEAFKGSSIPLGQIDHQVHRLYETHATPSLFVIDPNGTIRRGGSFDTESAIEQMLLEAQQPSEHHHRVDRNEVVEPSRR